MGTVVLVIASVFPFFNDISSQEISSLLVIALSAVIAVLLFLSCHHHDGLIGEPNTGDKKDHCNGGMKTPEIHHGDRGNNNGADEEPAAHLNIVAVIELDEPAKGQNKNATEHQVDDLAPGRAAAEANGLEPSIGEKDVEEEPTNGEDEAT